MSFMNPVDMVEEDAADLQFPKAEQRTCLWKPRQQREGQKRHKRMVSARVGPYTRYTTLYYSPAKLNALLVQCGEATADVGDDGEKCSTCQMALQAPYIKCYDCVAQLCVRCFAQGRETADGGHRNNHAYTVRNDEMAVFDAPGWSVSKERILLRTLKTQGYGNWEAVTAALGGGHTEAEVRQHYHDCYFGGIFERRMGLTHADDTYFPLRTPYIVKMNTVDPPRPDDIGSLQFKNMAGYRCARGDFDVPYDVSAESQLLAVMQQSVSDDWECDPIDEAWRPATEELQCALVRAYNHRLRERQRRYRIISACGLIMPNRTLGWISKYAHALGSEVNCHRFLAFMQLWEPTRFDMLVESLKYFADLQKTIFRLYELRQYGVRTLSGGLLYFKLKKERLLEQRSRYKDESQRQLMDWRKFIPTLSSNKATTNQTGAFTMQQTVSTAPRRKASPLDIIGLPGYARLNEAERQLCSVARVVPQSYLDYKNILLAENVKSGYVRLAEARRLIKIDVNKTRQIYDFLIENGHVNKPPN